MSKIKSVFRNLKFFMLGMGICAAVFIFLLGINFLIIYLTSTSGELLLYIILFVVYAGIIGYALKRYIDDRN